MMRLTRTRKADRGVGMGEKVVQAGVRVSEAALGVLGGACTSTAYLIKPVLCSSR